MSLFIGYHATPRRNRASILAHGLRAHTPDGRPNGVYVFNDDLHNPDAMSLQWSRGAGQDLWQVAYFGPMQPDRLCWNAVILPSVTPVTLVSGNA